LTFALCPLPFAVALVYRLSAGTIISRRT
jgi:hypothetical protein